MAEISTKVEAIRRFFADSKAANHPIKEHPVSKAEEYVRDLYLNMLCVVAQYECDDTENGFTLIRRIMAACEKPQPLQEYIKHSMEITPERTAEFIKQCRDNELGEIFMVDAMMLSCSNGSPNAKQTYFIAQFGDMLGFDRRKMEEMSRFALAILEHDSEEYQALLKDENAAVQESLLGYAKEFVNGMILNTSEMVHYYVKKSSESINVTDNCISLKNKKLAVFENITLTGICIYCEAVKKVKILNCKFKDYENYKEHVIRINTAESLKIENCLFCNIHLNNHRTPNIVSLNSVSIVQFTGIFASDISRYYGNNDCSGVFCTLSGHTNRITISCCEFHNCNPSKPNENEYWFGKNSINIVYFKSNSSYDKGVVEYSKFFSCNMGSALFPSYNFEFKENECVQCIRMR